MAAITVTCPSCSSSFPVDPAKIPEGGVNARCSSCGDIFRIEKPDPVPSVEDLAPSEPVAPAPSAPDTPAPEPERPAAGTDDPFARPAPFEQEAPEDVEPLPTLDDIEAVPVPDAEEALPEPDADEALPELEPAEPLPPPTGAETLPAPEADDAVPAPSPQPPAPEPGGPEPAEEVAETTAPQVQGFTFGKRDPKDKAKRLARVLVSDMIMYNAERHQSALAQGTLQQDFEEEIEKSWKEFVEQVGQELAEGEGRKYWKDALNDILAKGQQVF